MTHSYATLGLDSMLPFGKHEDEQVADVIEDHPGYMRWWIENIEDYVLDEECLQALASREARRT